MNTRQDRWDQRYLELAKHVGTWSKDPSTKVGAVLVRPNNSVASTGFNGFRPGEDDSPHLYADREYKLKNVVHAEVNAIEFLDGETAEGFTLYTSFPICPACIERAAAAGIRRVVFASLPVEGREQAWITEWRRKVGESLDIARDKGITVSIRHV